MQLFLLMWELSCCPENSFYQHFLGCQAADHGCFKQPCSLHFTSEGGTGSFADCSRCGVFAGEIEEPFPSLFPQEDSVWKNLGTLQWEQEQLLSSSISGTSDSQSGAGKVWRDLKREGMQGTVLQVTARESPELQEWNHSSQAGFSSVLGLEGAQVQKECWAFLSMLKVLISCRWAKATFFFLAKSTFFQVHFLAPAVVRLVKEINMWEWGFLMWASVYSAGFSLELSAMLGLNKLQFQTESWNSNGSLQVFSCRLGYFLGDTAQWILSSESSKGWAAAWLYILLCTYLLVTIEMTACLCLDRKSVKFVSLDWYFNSYN